MNSFYDLRRETLANLEHQLILRDKVGPDMQKGIDGYAERLYMILQDLGEICYIKEVDF